MPSHLTHAPEANEGQTKAAPAAPGGPSPWMSIQTRLALLSRLRLRPFCLFDVALSTCLCLVIVAIWYAGDFHAFHNSDSLIHTWASLYHWNVFAWELNQHGELLPLLTLLIKRPYSNLLTLSLLYSLTFLGGFAVWGSLLNRKTTLTESAIWASLVIPLILTKRALFENASAFMIFGASFFFAGWLVYWMRSRSRPNGRGQALGLALGLFVLSFLTLYTFQGTLILVIVLIAGSLVRHIRLELGKRQIKLTAAWSQLLPTAALGAAWLIYKILENSSPYARLDYYSFQISNIPAAFSKLVTNWAGQDLATLIPLLAPLFLLLCKSCSAHRRSIWLLYLTLGVLAQMTIFSGLDWVGVNSFRSWYLTSLSYLLILLVIVVAVALARTSIPLAADLGRRFKALRSTSNPVPAPSQDAARGYRLGLAAVFVLAMHVNALTWNAYSPAYPFSRLDKSIGYELPTLVEANCDILIGDYWKVWTSALALNDYYYRNDVIDPHSRTLRVVMALAYRSRPVESLWRPMLAWADVKLCAFRGDDKWVQWALSTYAPDVSLQKVGEQGDVDVYTIPWAGRFGEAEVLPGPSVTIRSLTFEFDRPVPGSGWGGPETWTENVSFQWMTAQVATFYVPLTTDQDRDVQFRVLFALAPDILHSLSLRVNDQPVALVRSQDQDGTVISRGTISKAILARGPGVTRLAFQVNRTVSPASLGISPTDPRQLGVAFDWLRIEPARPPAPR